MATVTNWNPFGVALNVTATGGTVTRKSATQFTVAISASWETYWSSNKTNYGMEVSSGGVTKGIPSYDGEKRSSGSGTFTGTYSISGNGSATKSISVTFRNYNTDAKKSATKTVTFNVTVPAWTSYTVTYNANGGSGAPAKQTKWKDQALTLSTTKPTRTGYSFLGWGTSSSATSATYSAGSALPSSVNANTTLYAVWKANEYQVTYNANGGSGAPAKQTKVYGVTLKLSSTKPTRTNYNFLGWATSASATKAQYAAGANYTTNAALTLYAVWELAYVKPRITNVRIRRVDNSGGYSETGTAAEISFNYQCDQPLQSIVVKYVSSQGEPDPIDITEQANADTDTSGDIDGFEISDVDPNATYTITITVSDTIGSSSFVSTLAGSKFVIDILAEGKGIAFNKPAEVEGVMDIGFKTRLLGGILYNVLEPETDLNVVLTPGFYVGENESSYNYSNSPIDAGTFTLEVLSAGINGQVLQRLTRCDKIKPLIFQRYWYQDSWGEWFWSGTDEILLYENDSGSAETITMKLNNTGNATSAVHFRYLEIYFTDNNGKGGGYTKIWKPNGKTISLQITEPSSTIYSRQTLYTISGTNITPDVSTASYYKITSAGAVSTSVGTNYIKIVRVIGRA